MGLGIDGSNTEPSDPESRDHKPIHLIKRAPTGAQIGESKWIYYFSEIVAKWLHSQLSP
jgi:hypothetical protein